MPLVQGYLRHVSELALPPQAVAEIERLAVAHHPGHQGCLGRHRHRANVGRRALGHSRGGGGAAAGGRRGSRGGGSRSNVGLAGPRVGLAGRCVGLAGRCVGLAGLRVGLARLRVGLAGWRVGLAGLRVGLARRSASRLAGRRGGLIGRGGGLTIGELLSGAVELELQELLHVADHIDLLAGLVVSAAQVAQQVVGTVQRQTVGQAVGIGGRLQPALPIRPEGQPVGDLHDLAAHEQERHTQAQGCREH